MQSGMELSPSKIAAANALAPLGPLGGNNADLRQMAAQRVEPKDACEATRDQSQDGRQVEETEALWTRVQQSQRRGRSGDRHFTQAYAFAARRLRLRASADDSTSDALVIAPLP
jgi:hypothetical protein